MGKPRATLLPSAPETDLNTASLSAAPSASAFCIHVICNGILCRTPNCVLALICFMFIGCFVGYFRRGNAHLEEFFRWAENALDGLIIRLRAIAACPFFRVLPFRI
jgi:hypothetical protein